MKFCCLCIPSRFSQAAQVRNADAEIPRLAVTWFPTPSKLQETLWFNRLAIPCRLNKGMRHVNEHQAMKTTWFKKPHTSPKVFLKHMEGSGLVQWAPRKQKGKEVEKQKLQTTALPYGLHYPELFTMCHVGLLFMYSMNAFSWVASSLRSRFEEGGLFSSYYSLSTFMPTVFI